MRLNEVAAYSRRHYETVRRAAVEYQRTAGKRGLKSSQPGTNACHIVHRDDVDRWLRGEVPARGRGRLSVAS
jgi:hypothetical protein